MPMRSGFLLHCTTAALKHALWNQFPLLERSYAEDPEASITFKEFRSLAWEAANEKARHLGWVKSYDELHEAVKRAGGAPGRLPMKPGRAVLE